MQRTARKSWVHVQVLLRGNQLYLSVSNSKHITPEPTSGGLGLANARKRLLVLYPGHTLQIRNKTTQYQVQLTLVLDDRLRIGSNLACRAYALLIETHRRALIVSPNATMC